MCGVGDEGTLNILPILVRFISFTIPLYFINFLFSCKPKQAYCAYNTKLIRNRWTCKLIMWWKLSNATMAINNLFSELYLWCEHGFALVNYQESTVFLMQHRIVYAPPYLQFQAVLFRRCLHYSLSSNRGRSQWVLSTLVEVLTALISKLLYNGTISQIDKKSFLLLSFDYLGRTVGSWKATCKNVVGL